ncbi:MAG TPA: Asp-tRNA(Asn)/Glu-tRNA(Gln) amidotransferase subunit GatA [Spirochaetota bacterium]|nr:Asp-tRNA(Asn)/Glu-tRNA(Gln) amidotransferase subunit GatA [Spirochaetota bacterium]
MDFSKLTVKKALQEIKSGNLDPFELLNYYIKNIEADNNKPTPLNAVIKLYKQQAETAVKKRSPEAPLSGLPVLVKDNFHVKGQETGCASRILQNYISPYDGGVTEKLKQAGAVIFGRTNMDEFAMGSTTEHSLYGPTRNPFNRDYIPGGSSGGAAASISSGQSLCSLGSDTGGSIRQPAAVCGAVGLKPTYGLVSRYGLVAFGSSLDQIGPVTRTVEDSALVLQHIAGYDQRDTTSVNRPLPDFSNKLNHSLKGKKIGLPREYFTKDLNEEIKKAIDKVVAFYKQQGAVIKDISLPATKYAVGAYYIICTAEASANLARYDGVRYGRRSSKAASLQDLYFNSRNEGFGSEVKRRIILGTYVLSSGFYDAYYVKAQKVRRIIKNGFNKAFNNVDLILTPAVPELTAGIGEKTDDPVKMYLLDIYTTALNLAGLPGLTVPCGRDSRGLPLAFQMVAPYFQEDDLLHAGHIFDKENNFQDLL